MFDSKMYSLQKSVSIKIAMLTCRICAGTTADLHLMMRRHCMVYSFCLWCYWTLFWILSKHFVHNKHLHAQVASNLFYTYSGHGLPLKTCYLDVNYVLLEGVFIRYSLQNLHTVWELKEEISTGVISTNVLKCRTWGSHNSCYEKFYFPGYNTVQSIENQHVRRAWYHHFQV
jgi:hypothetical protein